MTIRKRLTLRFTALVSSILLLAFTCLYALCWYFIGSDFYRRLDQKTSTIGTMLVRYRLNVPLIRQVSQMRRDQLPQQAIRVLDDRDSLLLTTGPVALVAVTPAQLNRIRQAGRSDFRQGRYYVSGRAFVTDTGRYVVLISARDQYGDAFLRQLLWALTGLFGLVVAITALAGWLFAGDSLRPMQQINQTLAHIFPRNRDERLPVRPDDDEISRLSTTINHLLDRAGESFRMQRMFVANVSHELKNPLTQISSQLEVSLLNERDPEAYRHTIRSVLDDVRDLAALTRELLQLSQVNPERAPADQQTALLTDALRLDELAWDIRDAVQPLNPHYDVTIELGTLPDDPDQLTVSANRTLLTTALKNLVENACKFAGDGRALVRIDVDRQRVIITVANTGPPIPPTDLPYIFEPFYRGRQTADVRGYGVGLALVQHIIRLHNGQIRVQSGPDTPTQFTVELPQWNCRSGTAPVELPG